MTVGRVPKKFQIEITRCKKSRIKRMYMLASQNEKKKIMNEPKNNSNFRSFEM